jgi:tetratricopeptide (TPR) repeat protein
VRRPAPVRSARPAGTSARGAAQRDPEREAEARIGAIPLLTALLVIGIVCAAGIAWMAPEPQTRDDFSARSSAKSSAGPSVPADAVAASEPVAPADTAFLDPAGAGALAYAAGNYAGALAEYQAAIERNPDDAESHSNLGQMLVRLKRAEQSLAHFDRAIAILPQRWAYHFNRARALALLERWDEAIAGYRHAQQLFPDDYATAFNLGQALHRNGDETAAVEQYKRAIGLDPSDPTFRLALAISYERLEKGPDAAAAYAEYLRLAPDAADAEKVRARIALLTRPTVETQLK